MNSLEIYESHHRVIHSLYSSRLKIQILLTLYIGNAPLSHLREITASSSQALIPKIRSLESQALIESVNHEYCLTPLGLVVARSIDNFIKLIGGINKHQDFFATHDISDLPREFLFRLGDLHSSDVKYDTTTDMFFVYSHYLEILKEAQYIHGISSVASPGLAEFIGQKVAAGIPVELVVSSDVIRLLKQEPYLSNMKEVISFPNFTIWVTETPLRIGLTVTDKYLSLGLYKLGINQYDSSTDLFSADPVAVSWGQQLFDYYRDGSHRIELDSFLKMD
jgi:predicted transcriptional regulator